MKKVHQLTTEIRNDLEKVVEKHKNSVKNKKGLDKLGRPPVPQDWKCNQRDYYFSFKIGKWVRYNPITWSAPSYTKTP